MKTTSKSLQAKSLGDLGEALVASLVGGVLSDDYYDQEKDMIDKDGNTVEVKTQDRHISYNILTVGINQFRKCFDVDRLIFVEFSIDDVVRVWELPKRQRNNYKGYTTAGGKQMIGWCPESQMELLKEIRNDEVAAKFRALSNSAFVKGKWKHAKQRTT